MVKTVSQTLLVNAQINPYTIQCLCYNPNEMRLTIMELRELEYFVTVAECGNMSDAAKKLCITQPTLSWNIKKLESYLHLPVFERSNKGVELTNVGRFLYMESKALLEEASSLENRIKEFASVNPTVIRVGLTPFTAVDYMYMFYDFEKKHPEYKIELINLGSKKLQEMVMNGELDLALVSEPMISKNLYKKKLNIKHGFHEIGLVINKYHPLSTKSKISFVDLEKEKVVTLSEQYVLFDAVSERFTKSNWSSNIAFASDNWELLLQHVQHWDSVAILPDDCKNKINTQLFTWIPFDTHEFKRFNLYFISKKDKPMFPYFDPFNALYDSISKD